MDTVKGYWTGYSYMGYVGKDVQGNVNGYLEFASEQDYLDWVK